MSATSIATASEIRAAHCAFIFSPPSSTNSVTIGRTAKIADRPSESETGLKSWVYTESPPSLGAARRLPARAIGETRIHGARRPVRHLPRRHAVPGRRAGGREAAQTAGRRGRVPGRADLLWPDAPEQRLRRRGPGTGAAACSGVRGVRGGCDALRILRGHAARATWRGGAVRPRAVGVPRGRAGGRGRGRVLPAPGHLPPALPLATCPAAPRAPR